MGKALRDGYRDRAFVMTKIEDDRKRRLPDNLMILAAFTRSIISTWSSTMRSFVLTIRTASFMRKERTRP